jgi:hypothetical protein
MIYKKPFLILSKVKGSSFNRDVHSDDYQNLLVNQSEIIDSVLHIDRFINDFIEYNTLYLNDILMSKNLSDFVQELINWRICMNNKTDLCVE